MGVLIELPWNLPLEFRQFVNKTKEVVREGTINVCIIGRKSWDSTPPQFLPFKGRLTIVLSRNPVAARKASNVPDDVPIVSSLSDALYWCMAPERAARIGKIWILGGVQLYNEGMKVSFGFRRACVLASPVCFCCQKDGPM